jgi:hypothetical protein
MEISPSKMRISARSLWEYNLGVSEDGDLTYGHLLIGKFMTTPWKMGVPSFHTNSNGELNMQHRGCTLRRWCDVLWDENGMGLYIYIWDIIFIQWSIEQFFGLCAWLNLGIINDVMMYGNLQTEDLLLGMATSWCWSTLPYAGGQIPNCRCSPSLCVDSSDFYWLNSWKTSG